MDKNFKIHDYCSYAHYQNNARSDRINLIHSKLKSLILLEKSETIMHSPK